VQGTALRRALLAAVLGAATAVLFALASVGTASGSAGTPAGSAGTPSASAAPAGPPPTASAGNQLHVIPFPGTPDASAQSQVIFSSLAPADLRSVTVVGSRSGLHAGHLSVLPDDAGTAFVPDHPFTDGEHVQVSAALRSPRAGTASGAPGATELNFSFTVAIPARVSVTEAADMAQDGLAGAPRAGTAGNGGRVQWFHSQTDFHPPVVDVSSDPDQSSGDIFLSPNNSPQVGAMIINSRGKLVWFRRSMHSADFNLEVQQYEGHPVLTWWHGNVSGGHGINGQDMIMGGSYRTMHIVTAGHGYSSDLHEFQIAPDGEALIDAYVPVHMNLSKYGGPKNGTVLDCVIQRIDIKTNRVLWEWHALGHIPFSNSYAGPTTAEPWDFFHLNSIQQQPNNNLLISSRNTWAVYLIGETKGSIIWTLGGKHSSFNMGSGTNFEWQHDARMIGQTLTVFNDGALPQEESESSAKEILINRASLTATLEHSFTHSPPLLAGSQGSAQTLSNNNVFVGWGSEPEFSEYTPSGQQIFNGSFPLGVTSYRAYRFHWQGQPGVAPAMANQPGRTGGVTVWASWNGATTVGGWRVLGGPKPSSLHVLDADTRSQGFETQMVLHSEPHYFAVQALGQKGHVLHTSAAHLDKRHLAIFGPTLFTHASNGYAGVPVGCYTGSDCSVSLRVRLKGVIVGQASAHHLNGGAGAVLYVQLSSRARSALARSSSHRVLFEVTARGTSGISTTTYLTGVPYSTSGSGPKRHVSQSAAVQVANTNGFASSSGNGAILAGCYAAVPCELRATLSAGGTQIASTSAEHLGVDELGDIYFQLNSAGQAMLAKASGNQLATQIRLTDGSSKATGQIALVRFS
jgi:hypothetical protein